MTPVVALGTKARPSGSAPRKRPTASRASASSPGRSPDRKRTGSDSRRSRHARWTSRTGSGQAPYEPWLRNVTVGIESPAEIEPHRAMTGVEITSPERATTVSPSWTGSGSQRASPGPTTRHVDRQAARGNGLLDHAGLLGQPEGTEAFGRPGGEPLDGRRPGRLLRVGHDHEARGRRGARPSRRRASRSTARTPSPRHWHRPGRRRRVRVGDRGPGRRARHDRRDEVGVAAREVDDVSGRELGGKAGVGGGLRGSRPERQTRSTSQAVARRRPAANAATPFAPARSGRPRAAAVGTTATRIGRPASARARAATGRSSAARNASSPARNSPPPWSATGPLIRARPVVGRRHVLDRRLRRLTGSAGRPGHRDRAHARRSATAVRARPRTAPGRRSAGSGSGTELRPGRTARRNASAHRQAAYSPIARLRNPASCSRRAGSRTISPRTRPMARRAGAGSMTR